jgi:hypothetical protein
MTVLPFDISKRGPVLIAGAGGGFDFLCGLPIALELEREGCEVHFANYSFTNLSDVENAVWRNNKLLEITADSSLLQGDYFPEQLLARWYREFKNKELTVWCIGRGGVVPTRASYEWLVETTGAQTVICIDGGVDGIFRGDEWDLGTPSMDSISVMATSLCGAPNRIYACTAFGTEGAEGKVSHAQALNRMADAICTDSMLGVGIILKSNPEGAEFLSAVETMYSWIPPLRRGIIVSSMVAAIRGAYGRTVVHEKTRDRPPWISPLTAMVWYFDADAIARMKLFFDDSVDSTEVLDVAKALDRAREEAGIKEHEPIPI